jgi:hypothetical protein
MLAEERVVFEGFVCAMRSTEINSGVGMCGCRASTSETPPFFLGVAAPQASLLQYLKSSNRTTAPTVTALVLLMNSLPHEINKAASSSSKSRDQTNPTSNLQLHMADSLFDVQ